MDSAAVSVERYPSRMSEHCRWMSCARAATGAIELASPSVGPEVFWIWIDDPKVRTVPAKVPLCDEHLARGQRLLQRYVGAF
jgi:hypothetical protein